MKLQTCTLIALMLMAMVGCAHEYTPVETYAEAEDPIALTLEQEAEWSGVTEPINGAWASADLRYSRSRVPKPAGHATLPLVPCRAGSSTTQNLV